MSVPHENVMFPGQEVTSGDENVGQPRIRTSSYCSTGACVGIEESPNGGLRIVDHAGGVALAGFDVGPEGLRDFLAAVKGQDASFEPVSPVA